MNGYVCPAVRVSDVDDGNRVLQSAERLFIERYHTRPSDIGPDLVYCSTLWIWPDQLVDGDVALTEEDLRDQADQGFAATG